MNYSAIFLVLVVFLVFFFIVATLLFYLRHLASRQVAAGHAPSLEGRYFKRYVPEQLRSTYDEKFAPKSAHFRRRRAARIKLATGVIIILAIGIPFYSIATNFDTYLRPIDLTPAEIARLDFSRHEWQRVVDLQLPRLDAVLGRMNAHTFIIPYAEHDRRWLVNGVNLRKMALDDWDSYNQEIHFSLVECHWTAFRQCRSENPSAIVLLLPGDWDEKAIDHALKDGASILAYGAPARLFNGHSDSLIWHGLTFKRVIKKDGGPLILLGDQLLTLGFDAGLILATDSDFRHFQATSPDPQAISIGDNYDAGGVHATRLYAKTVGAGRLVWMDFLPAVDDNSPKINVTHLQAVMAAVFRYLSKQPYSALSSWPDGKSFGALIEEDTEFEFTEAARTNNLVTKLGAPISWFMLSNLAQQHRSLTRSLAASGEVACHGDNHADFTKDDIREQTIRIARCQKVLQTLTGIRPEAFRPPEEKYNASTIDAIANLGMDHYIANNSPDRAVPEVLVARDDGKSLVSIPRMVSDDFTMWHVRNLDHADSLRLVDDEISWIHRVHGIYMFSFHTQFMGDDHHLNTVAHIITKLRDLGAYFGTAKEIAAWWRFRSNLQRGEAGRRSDFRRFKPIVLEVRERGVLRRVPFHGNMLYVTELEDSRAKTSQSVSQD